MKKKYVLLFFLLLSINLFAQLPRQVSLFPLNDVTLLDSPFKHAMEVDLKYILAMEPDKLLAPFLREAGLTPKAESYTNWENTGLDGHIGGHYLSALSLMYASTGDLEIKRRLDYMVVELKRCQDANGNGYIGGVPGGKMAWNEIAQGKIDVGKFSLNKKWVPLYNIHKTYAGLRDAWLYGKNDKAKSMLIGMTDWAVQLVSKLDEEQVQKLLVCEHGGLNEVFADVADLTGEKKYLRLAHQFSHKTIIEPLLKQEDKLNGLHANTQIPKIVGFKRIADVEGSKEWSDAAAFFWDAVVGNRSICTGGNSVNEQFNNSNNFSSMINSFEGTETCNTYNMLKLSEMLYQTSLDTKYLDFYERALYNHILSSQQPDQGGLVYFTPMRPGHYRVYSQPQTSMWCCVGSGMENHAKYGEMIYAHHGNMLYVNLFIPSRLIWREKGVEVVQENHFPDEPRTTLTINTLKITMFTIQIRYPNWVKEGDLSVKVNGQKQKVVTNKGYVLLKRSWKKGDKVSVELPMHLHTEQLPDHAAYYAFLYGPVVLAAKTGTEGMDGLFADDSRKGHEANGLRIPLNDMPILVAKPEQLIKNVEPLNVGPLRFCLNNLYPTQKWGSLELIPFFRVHNSRYIIYWPQATETEVKDLQQKMEKQEEERLRIDSVTVDVVTCGLQQPESDHFIQFDQSTTGYTNELYWREAKGWFTYQMRNRNKTAQFLYLTCLNPNKMASFEVFVNNNKLEVQPWTETKRAKLSEAVYPIPNTYRTSDTLVVRIAALQNATTPKISEVRLLVKKLER